MTVEVRRITAEELPTFVAADYTAFGFHATDDQLGDVEAQLTVDRAVAAFDGDVLVGTAAALSFDLTVPGLALVPAAGVTFVSVLPTHRRRGVMRELMAEQLADVAGRGEPLAVLTASEGTIYRRFGYGPATTYQTVEVDRSRAAFHAGVAADDGRVVLVDPERAKRALPAVFDRARRAQPGDHQRTEAFWDRWFQDRDSWRDGASARFYVLHETAAGEVDGYAAYRIKAGWDDHGVPNGTLRVGEVVSADARTYAALWRYLLEVDLVATVRADVPADDPLRFLLEDPRAVRVPTTGDDLWVRVLDVPAALSARSYEADDRLVLEVVDRFRPETGGCFVLDDGKCTRADDGTAADLALDVTELGSIYLGGVAPSVLARAARIEERTPGALDRADALFRTAPLPFNRTEF